MRGSAQTSEPIIQYVYQLIDAIAEGRLLIPRFQRPLVWTWDRQAELLRSVRDGIPMGAVMIWRTSKDRIKWQSELAGHSLPNPPKETPREYLLDGLQRLSTLFAALRGHGANGLGEDRSDTTIGYDLDESIFVEIPRGKTPNKGIVPLNVLPDSVQTLRFQRSLTGSKADEWITRSDALAKAFREYKVPVIPIVSEEFEMAARTFNLINSQGVRMGEADMIHALTWSSKFELRDRIESLRAELLQPLGWGGIDFEAVLKVVKAEADLDLYEESVEQISAVLKKDPSALDRAFERIRSVAKLLRQSGILCWELVPYALQVVLLADAYRFGKGKNFESVLGDWFWLTTYGEMFAGLSGHRLGIALRDLRSTCKTGSVTWSATGKFAVRPLPASADFRAVRVKALSLMLARQQAAADPSANDPFRILNDHRREALFQVIPRHLTDKVTYSSPANRFLCAPEEAIQLKQEVLSGKIDSDRQREHLIPPRAVESAKEGDWDGFVQARLELLSATEEAFVNELLERHPLQE